MTTIAEYLRTQFGERAAFVEGFDHPSLGGSPFSGAELAVREGGSPYVSCGGDSLIAFKPAPTSYVQAYIRTPCPIYLSMTTARAAPGMRAVRATRPATPIVHTPSSASCRRANP